MSNRLASTWLSALVWSCAILLAACGREAKSGLTPAPTASPIVRPALTPQPMMTPTPALPPTISPAIPVVRFVPAQLPLFTGEELENPFAGETPGPTEWSVYLVRGDGPPELIYQTHRWVWDLDWSADGRTVITHFSSRSAPGPLSSVRGVVFFDVGRPTVATSELVMESFTSIRLSPSGSRVALELYRGPDAWQIYVTDYGGRASKLEGLGDKARLVGWVPNGSGLLVYVIKGPTIADGLLYLVPLADGPPTLVAPQVVTYYNVVWSPDGTQLAYESGGDLYVFDRATGQSLRVTSGAKYKRERPNWSPGGR